MAPLLVAGLTKRDLQRNVGAWRLPLLTSALLAIMFVGVAAVTQGFQQRFDTISFRTAVAGDVDGGRALVDGLSGGDLLIQPSHDAARDVGDSDAAVGLSLPEGLDAALEQGDPVVLPILRREAQHNSLAGSTRLSTRLTLLLGTPTRSITITDDDIGDDLEANRDGFARTAGGFSAFLMLGVVTATASILGRTRERRGAEPLLVLPVPRTAITAGVAIGAMPMAIAYLGVGLAVVLGASTLPLPTLGQPVGVLTGALPAAVATTVALAALGAALGVLAGSAGGGSEDSVGLGDLLTMPVLALGLTLLIVPTLPTNATTLLTPGLGPMIVLRDGLLGDGSPASVVLATGATLVAAGGLVVLAAKVLDSERNVRRI